MKLSFVNSVIFPEWIEKYDEEVISNIKSVAQAHGRYLKRNNDYPYIVKRSMELSESSRYKDFNSIQKLIFISNIVFENDDRIMQVMDTYGWTKEKTEALNFLISRIKFLQKRNCKINFDLSLIEEIMHISSTYFGISNPAILINRLNELTVTKKEELSHKRTK